MTALYSTDDRHKFHQISRSSRHLKKNMCVVRPVSTATMGTSLNMRTKTFTVKTCSFESLALYKLLIYLLANITQLNIDYDTLHNDDNR